PRQLNGESFHARGKRKKSLPRSIEVDGDIYTGIMTRDISLHRLFEQGCGLELNHSPIGVEEILPGLIDLDMDELMGSDVDPIDSGRAKLEFGDDLESMGSTSLPISSS